MRPDLALDEEAVEAIADITRALDGLARAADAARRNGWDDVFADAALGMWGQSPFRASQDQTVIPMLDEIVEVDDDELCARQGLVDLAREYNLIGAVGLGRVEVFGPLAEGGIQNVLLRLLRQRGGQLTAEEALGGEIEQGATRLLIEDLAGIGQGQTVRRGDHRHRYDGKPVWYRLDQE